MTHTIEDVAGNKLTTKYRPTLIKQLQVTIGCTRECLGRCLKSKQIETWDEEGVRKVRKLCHLKIKI